MPHSRFFGFGGPARRSALLFRSLDFFRFGAVVFGSGKNCGADKLSSVSARLPHVSLLWSVFSDRPVAGMFEGGRLGISPNLRGLSHPHPYLRGSLSLPNDSADFRLGGVLSLLFPPGDDPAPYQVRGNVPVG